MIHLKTPQQIEIMKQGGKILRQSADELVPLIKAGWTTLDVDKKAEEIIRRRGGEPSFTKVKGYKWTTCLPVNEQVVHTPPSKRVLKEGDVLTLDIGVFYKGFHTDYAITFVIGGKTDKKTEAFLQKGRETLTKAIKLAQNGKYIGEISQFVQKEIEGAGYFILKDLTGHGIGKDLHEEPYVPNFQSGPIKNTYKMRPGLVIAIEVIYSIGSEDIQYQDSWSIATADNSLSACFENTVAITDKKTFILT